MNYHLLYTVLCNANVVDLMGMASAVVILLDTG